MGILGRFFELGVDVRALRVNFVPLEVEFWSLEVGRRILALVLVVDLGVWGSILGV